MADVVSPGNLEDVLSGELYDAWKGAAPVGPLTERHPGLTIEQAYRIQLKLLEIRNRADGERIIGKKIGVTSRAVMELLKVDQPDFGMLTDAMVRETGAEVAVDRLIAPKVEGEIAFLLKDDLKGPGVTAADVLRATELVLPCIEIVDSRIRDWRIRIEDTVADNASAALFVLGGQAKPPSALDLPLLGMTLEINGEIVTTGAGAASLGDPARAVAWLANTLSGLGIDLKAGEIILSGSLGAMPPAKAGDNVRVEIGGLGAASVRFV